MPSFLNLPAQNSTQSSPRSPLALLHLSERMVSEDRVERDCFRGISLISPLIFKSPPAIRLASSKFTDYPNALDALANQYATALSPAGIAEFALLLSVLSTTAGTTLFTGHLKPITQVCISIFLQRLGLISMDSRQLSSDQIEKVLQTWGNSMIPALRKASKGRFNFSQSSQVLRADAATGLTSIPLFVAYSNITENVQATGYPAPAVGPNTRQGLVASYPFKFESISAPYEIIETDILIIGSGSGGGVAAAVLSAGRKTLITEKGPFSPEEEWSGNPAESFARNYQNSGIMANDEGSMVGSSFYSL